MPEKQEENQDQEQEESIPQPPPEMRAMGIFGDITETKAEEVVYALRVLSNESPEDIDMYVSTQGGTAVDMFSIYDVMRITKETNDISTFGLGKVMSAGVVILASGTKGKRRIGKSCRVMLHSVVAGSSGPLHDLENEMLEVKYTQEMYISALSDETNLTKDQIREMVARNVNVYLSAEEAVSYGIADVVV